MMQPQNKNRFYKERIEKMLETANTRQLKLIYYFVIALLR